MRIQMAAVLLVVACKSGTTGNAGECRADAMGLAKLLGDAPHDEDLFPLTGRRLVKRDDLPVQPTVLGPVIDVRQNGTSYQGQLVTDVAELSARLAAARARIVDGTSITRKQDPDLVYLLIDQDAPWSNVVMAFDAAERANMRKQAFVFEVPNKVQRPPRAAIDDELDAIESGSASSAGATELAKKVKDATQGCASLLRLYGEIAKVEATSKSDALIAGLPQALVDCKCDLDMPRLRSVLWRLLVPAHPTGAIVFDPGERTQTIAHPGTTPWSEASRDFPSRLTGATLRVQ